jgi:peptidoglycan-associated lipoprotein
MTPRPVRSLRLVALALAIGSLTLACSRAPKNHWWQFWRRGAPSEVVHVDDQMIPGPLDYQSGTSGHLTADELAFNPDQATVGLPEPAAIRQDVQGVLTDLVTIYFDYDSFQLTPEARDALREDARWIAAHPDLAIRIEGHCDERGTEEYNYNLGMKRAQAVREYLVTLGAQEDRLHTWSWGETRPLDPGHAESAWQRNRRVQFAVWSTD